MDEKTASYNRRKKGFPWIGAALLLLVCGGIGLCFTGFPGKVKRGLKEIFAPKPLVVAADSKDIYRQAEARIRAEVEEKYEREIAALKKSLDDAAKQSTEEARSRSRSRKSSLAPSPTFGSSAPASRSKPR